MSRKTAVTHAESTSWSRWAFSRVFVDFVSERHQRSFVASDYFQLGLGLGLELGFWLGLGLEKKREEKREEKRREKTEEGRKRIKIIFMGFLPVILMGVYRCSNVV